LAPLVSDRKGEHAQLISELAGQGFARVRVDGTVYELDQVPALAARRKHTIEAVVDRFRVRPELSQRLAESFETALKLSSGTARVVFLDEPALAPLVFFSTPARPECGFSVPNLEPRLFSFNIPAGACPSCDGLGVQSYFDPQRVISHAHLSLAAGAVRGWDTHHKHTFQLLEGLARHYEFDIDTPFSELPEAIRQRLLYGSEGAEIEFRYYDARGSAQRRRHAFEGIMPNLERRWRESDSNVVREELSRYRGMRA